MIFKIFKENMQLPLPKGFVYYFSVGPYVYIEDNPQPIKTWVSTLTTENGGNQVLLNSKTTDSEPTLVPELDYYVPSEAERQAMLAEFTEWKNKFKVLNTGNIESFLGSSLQPYKDAMTRNYEAKMESYDDSLVNNDMYFYSSLGFKCNGDRRTLENIRGLIETVATSLTAIPYRDYNNEIHQLSKSETQKLLTELQKNMLNLYTLKWDTQDAIAKAETPEALMAINLEPVWLDFRA